MILNNKIKFLTSSTHYLCNHVQSDGIEIAFVGYSNVGKSTAINFLTNINKISRCSRYPGRTNMINFFLINKNLRFVDLPGYGYSKYHINKIKKIYVLIFQYLRYRSCLKGIILFIDIRRLLRHLDKKILILLHNRSVNIIIFLTKCDKLNKIEQNRQFYILKKELKKYVKNIPIILFSSLYKNNKGNILNILKKWIYFDQ